jgi:hypothetical protein
MYVSQYILGFLVNVFIKLVLLDFYIIITLFKIVFSKLFLGCI